MDRRDGLDGKPEFFVMLVAVLLNPQAFIASPIWIQQHGGAAAILPYVIGVLMLGIPLVFLELSLGQFMQKSGTRLWAVAPLFKGLAISSMLLSLVRSSVNSVMASWAGFYIYLTLTNQIPSCNTTCLSQLKSSSNENYDWSIGQLEHNTLSTHVVQNEPNNSFEFVISDPHHNIENTLFKRKHQAMPFSEQQLSSSQSQDISDELLWNFTAFDKEFVDTWRNDILEASTSITVPGKSVLHLFIGNAAIVFVSILITVFGAGAMRKVVTSLLPVAMAILVAIVVRTCVWDIVGHGVSKRLSAVLAADFELLTCPYTWFSCCHHVLLIHGLSVGVLPSLSSYLKWNNNAFRDAIYYCVLAAVINIVCSLLVYVVIVPVALLDSQNPFLFTSMPLSLALLPRFYVWIVSFFLLLIVVIITTNALYWQAAILTVTDASKKLSKWKILVVIGAASFVFLLTIPMSLQNGIYIYRMLYFVVFGPFLVGIICLVQLLVMAFVYGGHKFYDNLETMTGYRPHWWLRFAWAWVCPGLVLASICYSGYYMYNNPIILGSSSPYPDLSNMLLVVVSGMMLLPVPLAAVWVLCSGPVGCLKKLKWSIQPRLHPFQIPIRWRLERKWHKFSPL